MQYRIHRIDDQNACAEGENPKDSLRFFCSVQVNQGSNGK